LQGGLAFSRFAALPSLCKMKGIRMGIDTERDIEANLQIGPTDRGMVRIFIEGQGIEIPMDFEPDEADEIADEIKAAAQAARAFRR
jgi:phage tail sheath gpL-like